MFPTNGATVIPRTLQHSILKMEHEPVRAVHSSGRKVHTSIRRYYYWPRMSIDCYNVVDSSLECVKSRSELQSQATPMAPFLAESPLEDIAMDALGPLLTTTRGNMNLLIFLNRFTKLVRAIPMGSVTSAKFAAMLVHHWVFVYGHPIRYSRIMEETSGRILC